MPRKRVEIAQRLHALEHLLAGLIRKYGDDGGKRVSLEEETYNGDFTIVLDTGHLPGCIVVELATCQDCADGGDHDHGP